MQLWNSTRTPEYFIPIKLRQNSSSGSREEVLDVTNSPTLTDL